MAKNFDVNSYIITGNICKDAELKTSQSGIKYCTFCVANNTSVKKNDEWVEKPNFFFCTIFGNFAEAVQPKIKTGKPALVFGSLTTSSYEENGQTKNRINLKVKGLKIFEKKSNILEESSKVTPNVEIADFETAEDALAYAAAEQAFDGDIF